MAAAVAGAPAPKPTGDAIGVVLTRRVTAQHAPAFESGLRRLIDAASSQPGHERAEVLRGASPSGWRDYHVIYTFADEESLRAWESTSTRQALVASLEPLATDASRQELTGLEAWFDAPPGASPPSRHRMGLLTWLAIWPLVSLALRFLAPHLGTLPFLLRTATVTALLVLAMTYVVMHW